MAKTFIHNQPEMLSFEFCNDCSHSFRMQSHKILFALSTVHVKSRVLDSICAGVVVVVLHGCQVHCFTCCKFAETL